MPKVLIGGVPTDIDISQIFQDDGTTPFVTPPPAPPTGQTFTAADVERIRQEEKDKLYKEQTRLREEITGLQSQVGTLTAAEQQRLEAAEAEQARLAEEQRKQEEEGLSAKELILRKQKEFQDELAKRDEEWNNRFTQAEEQRQQAEALAAKEREFGALRDYTLAQVEAHKDEIAPQFLPYIQGTTREEIDASVTQAVTATNEILTEMQQALAAQQQTPGLPVYAQPQQLPVPVPAQQVPGVSPNAGPANFDPSGEGTRQLSAQDIANMPMSEYAKLRGNLGIERQNNDRGLFG